MVSRSRASFVGDRWGGIDQDGTEVGVRLEPVDVAAGEGEGEATEHRRRRVVRMTLDPLRRREHARTVVLPSQAEQDRREHHAGDGRRRGGAQSPFEGDAVHTADRACGRVNPHPGRHIRDRARHEIGAIDRELAGALPLPGDARRGLRLRLDLIAEVEREPEAVEPGAEVRGGGGDTDRDVHGAERSAGSALAREGPTYSPSSSATSAASAGTVDGRAAPEIAHSGSFRP